MRASRFLLVTFAALFMFGSLTLDGPLMTEPANAVCRPWPWPQWAGLVAGTVTVTDTKAKVTTDTLEKKGLSWDFDVSPEVVDTFKNEEGGSLIGKPVSGFIILTGMKMIAFVPITREHEVTQTFSKITIQKAINDYNNVFETFVKSGGTIPPQQ